MQPQQNNYTSVNTATSRPYTGHAGEQHRGAEKGNELLWIQPSYSDFGAAVAVGAGNSMWCLLCFCRGSF